MGSESVQNRLKTGPKRPKSIPGGPKSRFLEVKKGRFSENSHIEGSKKVDFKAKKVDSGG